ncbi:MAG TPA: homoprotocatechuate degradation operon regulator HpaR [Woeseiaceae bacterium]|nr:homoprotocatechuate degradation operon regulator HpaR [Woeseiaceae bacterium]
MSKSEASLNSRSLRDFRHSLPMELLKAREAAMARFRPMLRTFGLTEQQWRVLRALSEFDALDASELAKRSFLLAPSLTRILQHLEAKSLLRRSYDDNDQRRLVVEITAAGRRLFEQVAPESEQLYSGIEEEFGSERLERMYELLADFYEVLGTN